MNIECAPLWERVRPLHPETQGWGPGETAKKAGTPRSKENESGLMTTTTTIQIRKFMLTKHGNDIEREIDISSHLM